MSRPGARAPWPIAALAVLLALASPAHAANEAAGTTVGSFLVVGAGASVLSMAGATLATGNDLASAAWNPASLARVDALQFSLSHAPLPGGATQDWLAAGGRVRGGATRWAAQALFHQEGDIEGRDASNNPTGALQVTDLALGARLAHPLGRVVSAGLGAQWIVESLAGTSGSGFAIDAGLRAQTGPVGFALAARNLGIGLSYAGTRYDLPALVAGGVSWSDEARGVRLAADLESPSHYYRDVRLGGEWTWRERVAVRAGYRLEMGAPEDEQLSGASFGLGTGVGGMWMDYAFSPSASDGSGEHRIGLTFRPGQQGQGGEGIQTQHAPPRVAKPKAPAREVPATKSGTPKNSTGSPAAKTQEASTAAPSKPVPAPPATPVPAAVAPTPASTREPESTRVAPAPIVRPAYVVVAEGETLASIARRWGTTVSAIMMTNNLVREQVPAGTRLKLPPATTR